MEWTRTPTEWADAPVVHALADALRLPPMQVVGHLLTVWSKLPALAADGDLSKVPGALLESWAQWRGKRGAFDAAFRSLVLDPTGVWREWDLLNGAVLREKAVDRDRAAERRRLLKLAKEQQLDAFAAQTAAALAKCPPDGPPDSPPDRPALRTNGRSATTAGARARNGTTDPARFVPGHVNLPAGKFCAHCDGVTEPSGPSKRLTLTHAIGCPLRAPAPRPLEILA